jgi:arylsulfatase A-like enzyme
LELIDEAGAEHELWNRALAPGQNPNHRDWFEEDLDLGAFARQEVGLRFTSLACAPVSAPFERSGDPADDAALIGVPRIYRGEDRAINVLILLIDSLRADRLSLYGYARDVDPHLRGLAEEAVLFERAYAPAPWTVPSTASLLTGLYPNLHGKGIVRGDRTRFREDAFFLAEALQDAGFRTGIISNNPLIVPSNGFDRGIDEFDVRTNEDGWYYGGERLSAAATAWLDRHPLQPFCLYVHYFDPHYPYQAPPNWTRSYVDPQSGSAIDDERILAGDANHARRRIVAKSEGPQSVLPPREHVSYLEALYDAETRYADEMIGGVLEALEQRNLLDRTLVIVTSDHGEEFLEHGFLTHGHSLYEELLRIPLIVRFPDGTGRRTRIETPVSLVDVAPTVLSFLGLPLPTTPLLSGCDLYEPLRQRGRLDSRPIFAHSAGAGEGTGLPQHGPKRAVIDWPLKLIDDIDGPAFIYDLERDPEERRWRQFAKEYGPERRRQLEALADSALALPDDWQHDLEEMSPQLLRDLRALGYVE